MWFGRPGALVELPDPQEIDGKVNIAMDSTRESTLHVSAAGGATVQHSYIQPLRSWTLPYTLMSEYELGLIRAYHKGRNGKGPWVMLLGIETNHLSANQATATDQFGDTTGFSATAGDLSSTSLYSIQGSRSLLWQTPASPVADSYISLSWHGSTYGYPCVPGKELTFSLQTSGSTASQVIRPALAFFDATGAALSTTLGPLSNTSASLSVYKPTFTTAIVPSGGVYVQPRLIVTSPVASASITLDELQLQDGQDNTVWTDPSPIPLVSITNFDYTANYNPYFSAEGVLLQEVGNARR